MADLRTSGCERFDDQAAELALGLLDPTEADSLIAHARGCDRCRGELDGLSDVADRLPLLAPEADPPAGFEGRALAAMGGSVGPQLVSRSRRAALATAVAALLVAVGVGAGLLAGGYPPRTRTIVVSAVIDTGRSELTMSLDGLDAGETYRCALRTPDGAVTEIAAWTLRDDGGTWTMPLDDRLVGATTAIVTDGDGAPVATAPLR